MWRGDEIVSGYIFVVPPIKFPIGQQKIKDLQLRMRELGVLEEDLEERFIRAQGPGGQKVNKTSSAVVLKHLPTETEVRAQSHRSQVMNRYLARKLLVEKMESQRDGQLSRAAARIAKVRRQKRKRSKRAREKMLKDKKIVSEKKTLRRNVNPKDY